jgi:hypothetical protein
MVTRGARGRGQARQGANADNERAQPAAHVEWERWLRGHIEAERAYMIEVVGQAIGQIRAELRAEFRHEIALAVSEIRHAIATAKARDDGSLVDLPNPLVRKRTDAA